MPSQPLDSAEKVAILMITLGEDIAAEVFRQLSPIEVKRIGSALSRMGNVDKATADIVLNEFLGLLKTKRSSLDRDGASFARKAIELAFKPELADSYNDALRKSQASLRSIQNVDASVLARILENEHPQTIALVLAHTHPEQGAALVRLLPESLRTDLLARVAQMSAVDPETILELDAHLQQEIERIGMQQKTKVGGPKQAASILNYLEDDGRRILENLEERQPQLAEDIRSLMFTFEDLSTIDRRGIQELIRVVPRTVLTLALRGTSDALIQLFCQNMSQRSGEALREDIQALGPQKKDAVVKAQRDVLSHVKQLIETGKIILEKDHKQAV